MTSLRDTLLSNGYTHNIKKAIRLTNTKAHITGGDLSHITEKTKQTLPYIKGTTDRIGRILKQHKVRTTFNTHTKINNFLRNAKDQIHLEGQGVYLIPCGNCEKIYISNSGRNICQHVQKHALAIDRKLGNASLMTHITDRPQN